MAYLLGYQVQFENVEGQAVEVNIYDTLSGTGTTTFTQLTGTDNPCRIFVVDNDEDKFTPIKAKQCEIRFISTATENLNTFLGSEDERWLVEILVNSVLQFRGFLILDDIDEDFLDSDAANVVTLIGSDGLGLTKGEPLTDFAGHNPRNYHRIIEYIAFALAKTGQDLPINVINNVREEHNTATIMYQACFIGAKTFEAEIGTCISAYDTLVSILGEDCFLTQYRGEWWIFRLDEMNAGGSTVWTFDSNGTPTGSAPFDIIQQIGGTGADMLFSNMSTFVKGQMALREVKETYNYELPREIIDNIDFDRSATGGVEPVTYVEGGITYTKMKFPLEDWIFRRGFSDLVTTQGEVYIRRVFQDGYEKERYVVIQKNVNGNLFIASNRIPLGYRDKFTISVNSKHDNDQSGSGGYTENTIQVRLYGEDGTHWTLHGGTSIDPLVRWEPCGPGFNSNQHYVVTTGNLSEDQREWKSASATASPIPVAGEIEVLLQFEKNWFSEIHFQNLQFSYEPLINGSYQKYTGQHHKISQAINVRRTRDNTVKISDSPRKLFKGALFRFDGTHYVLTGRFYDGRQFPSGLPADSFLHPFGEQQTRSVWIHYSRTMRLFDVEIDGLQTGTEMPDLVHRFIIGEASPHTNDKYFMLLHGEFDLNNCSWKGVLVEVEDTTIPLDFTSPHEFKYISER